MKRPLLIAGVGNMFFGDDAFGCEVARRLIESHSPLPHHVELRDYGVSVRGLAYRLAERSARGHDTTVIVDAIATGAAPGTVQLFHLDTTERAASRLVAQHPAGLDDALTTALELGASLRRTYLLGCEPASLEPVVGERSAGLTPVVEQAARQCVQILQRLINEPDNDLVSLCASS